MVKSVTCDVNKYAGPFETISLNLTDYLSAIAVALPRQALLSKILVSSHRR